MLIIEDVSHGVLDLRTSDGRVEMCTVSDNHPRVADTEEENKREVYAATRDGHSRRVQAIQTATMPLWSVEEALLCRRALRLDWRGTITTRPLAVFAVNKAAIH